MKLKTNKSAKKRFKVSGSGKVQMQRSCKGHLLVHKSKRSRKLGKGGYVDAPKAMFKNIGRMLGISAK
jgi:large subunit ribosomal protein L35